MRWGLIIVAVGLVVGVAVASCGTTVVVSPGSGGSSSSSPTSTSSAGGASGSAGGASASGGGAGGSAGGAGGCAPVVCPDGQVHECGDCIDNDGDGLIDGQDSGCVGACDGLSWYETNDCPGLECQTAEDCGLNEWNCITGCCM